MNKASSCSHRYLLRIVLLACILIALTAVQTAGADGAPPPEPDTGGVAPYQPIETNVQMMSETVLIDVLANPTRWTSSELSWTPNQVKVTASFTLRNQGTKEEKMQVIFPLTRLDYPWLISSYNIISSSFVARVDGQQVSTTSVTTPPELSATPAGPGFDTMPDGSFLPAVQWAGFDVSFPVQQDVIVQVQYDMAGDITTGLHHVDYILETGAGWYGKILSADIIVRLPYPATGESVPETAAGCTFSGNEVQCQRKNFEPKRKDNLTFGFIDTNKWPPALELRARVQQYPQDADAWYQLATQYSSLGIWWQDVIIDQHIVDLSIEAYRKAIALRPDWGSAHMGLARLLWVNNPKYRRGFQGNALQKDLSAYDPMVQQALQELKLAASYGLPYNIYNTELVNEMKGVIPDLESLLPAAAQLTPTLSSPPLTPRATSDVIQKVTALAMGKYHTCVLMTGEVKCQGLNLQTSLAGDIQAVAAGDYYTCMLMTNGSAKCMGQNRFGQLGDGTTIERNSPVDVLGLTSGVSALVAGDNHTCALMRQGSVKCWGRNYFGQLGDGTNAYSVEPVDVQGLSSGVVSLAAGSDHTCALLHGGRVQCWGANEASQLGDGSLVNRSEPVDVVGLPADILALAAGFAHTCALDSKGQVLCWGSNSHGQLGDADLAVHNLPKIVPGLDGAIVKVAAANDYTCVLTNKGGVKCWGRNDEYVQQLGDGTEIESYHPVDVVDLPRGVLDIAARNDHTCALLQNGKVKCWGTAEFGYSGPETQYGPLEDSTPTPILVWPTSMPAPLPTSVPMEISSSEDAGMNPAWLLMALIGLGVLAIWIRGAKNNK